MSKVMIWKITTWKPGTRGDGAGFDNLLIVCKGIDDNQQYNLNLNMKQEDVVRKWLPAMVEGNVLEVTIKITQFPGQKKPTSYVDKYAPFTLIDQTEKGKEATMPDGSLPGQTTLI